MPGMKPADKDIIVDPAGLMHITPNTPHEAHHASGAIYAFLKINKPHGFPPDVRGTIHAECDAHGHVYPAAACEIGVVHVVGP
eukprot:10772266-Alexandrium_andersonii.AAC.1